tara:strand:+ start:205 stop:477 length:273 start_codon:yes stop_codon:yes gene_type:complete
MKVKDLLDVQEVLEKRKTPYDMNGDLNQHFSTSKEEYIDILDMDLIHLIRSYSKCIGNTNNHFDSRFHVHEKIKKIKKEAIEIEEIIIDL